YFGGPMTETDYLERYGAVETFLTGPINHALTAAADFLQQFIVAQVDRRFCQTRSFPDLGRSMGVTISNRTALVVGGQRRGRKQTETCLKQTGRAKSFRSGCKDFYFALSTN